MTRWPISERRNRVPTFCALRLAIRSTRPVPESRAGVGRVQLRVPVDVGSCRIRSSGFSDCDGRLEVRISSSPWSYVAGAGTWPRATRYGTAVPGAYLPDLEHAGCILYWGYNPAVSRLVHATQTVAALNRGARLIVVDPRRRGLLKRADHWLRVRPGTDGALALAMAHVMIDRGWFDREFVCRWTNGPFLVRADNGRLLREQDLSAFGDANKYVAWDNTSGEARRLQSEARVV